MPNRERPAAARMVPSASMVTAIFRNLVSTFPLNSIHETDGKRNFNWAIREDYLKPLLLSHYPLSNQNISGILTLSKRSNG